MLAHAYALDLNLSDSFRWIQSTTFASYMLSRAIGGLSEGNVQLAMLDMTAFYSFSKISDTGFSAILSDITTPANRARALSQVGIAFAICFIIGPPIGAYFASRPFPISMGNVELNIYATPAIL